MFLSFLFQVFGQTPFYTVENSQWGLWPEIPHDLVSMILEWWMVWDREEADGFEVWIGGGEATGAHDRVTMEETIKRVSRTNRIKPGRQFSFLHVYCLGRPLLLSSFLCILVHG